MASTIKVLIFKEQGDGSLRRIQALDIPATSQTPEQDAWRQVGRGVDLQEGNYQVMRAGRRGRVEKQARYAATDLGAIT